MNADFDFYGVVWAVEYCSKVLDGISDAPDTKDFGLDSNADYDKYYNKLYELYDIAIANDAVSQVIDELNSDGVDPYYFNEIKEEDEGFKKQSAQEELANSVEVGDYVRLRNGNKFYVCDREGRNLWVTNKKEDRTNLDARGWHADLYDIVEILERYNED